MARDYAAPAYARGLHVHKGRTLIKAVCEYCGFEIIDSYPEIVEREWEHRRECKKPKAAKA